LQHKEISRETRSCSDTLFKRLTLKIFYIMRKEKLILLCIFLAMPCFVRAQVVSALRNTVLDIVKSRFQNKDVDYYLMADTAASPYLYKGKTAIFVDTEPLKGWNHKGFIYLFPAKMLVNVSYTPIIQAVTTPPKAEYFPLEVQERYDINSSAKPSVVTKTPTSEEQAVANRTYALIISGGINPMANKERYWNDCSFIYQTLVNRYGVPKENIFPLMSDGADPADDMLNVSGEYVSQSLDLDFDGEDEIEYAATSSNIQSVLASLSETMSEEDHLFVYVIDHGGSTDNDTDSYICLWDYETLYDYELANMLQPFISKSVNVNVVLGQCFSGGFIDNLTKAGCVVASACKGSEYSWACTDIPYDEFVYQWTCAVNGATHLGGTVDADTDANKHVTMDEAFVYAKENDRRTGENPQYASTPLSVGEDLSFDKIAPSVDLYIKDNPEDTGKEPNLTTDKFWKSSSIWTRNQDDGIEEHQNPVYSSDHLCAVVYVKVHNRGKADYTGTNKYVHVYWALASTSVTQATWKGLKVNANGNITGEHLRAVPIPKINAGDSAIVKVTWQLPADLMGNVGDNGTEKHHFCLLAKIMDSYLDDGYAEGVSYFDVKGSNNQAQKNVSIVSRTELNMETDVFVWNMLDVEEPFSLEIVPCTDADKEIYSNAKIEVEMAPVVYSAWAKGGSMSNGISATSSNIVEFTSEESRLEGIRLASNEYDKISLKFKFSNAEATEKTYSVDLIQRDSNGDIVGGETFVVEAPVLTEAAPNVTVTSNEAGLYTLSADSAGNQYILWADNNGHIVGEGASISVNPAVQGREYSAAMVSADGYLSTQAILLDTSYGIKSVSCDATGSNNMEITLYGHAAADAYIRISSTTDGVSAVSKAVPAGESSVSVDVSVLPAGLYVVAYMVDGAVADTRKISIK